MLLDGGLASQLEHRGADLSGALWSARLIDEQPEAIRQAHRDFFAQGAQVATTASYQAGIDNVTATGLDPVAVLRSSVSLAREARDEHGSGWVAASVGPYGAVLADGSEYHGRYGHTVAELRRFHRPRLQILADAEPDVLAVETIPCLAEVEALVAELELLDFPAWLSLTCTGTRTRAGEPAAEAFAMARDCAAVFAVGVNCSDPGDVADLVRLAHAGSGKPAVAYPNSGQSWDADTRTWVGHPGGGPAFGAGTVSGWLGDGARLIGGCCQVLASDIGRLRADLDGRPRSGTVDSVPV